MVMMARSCVVLLVVMLLFVCGVYVSQTSTGDHDTGKGYAVVQIEYSVPEIKHDEHYSFVGGRGMQRRELRKKVKLPPSPKRNPPRHYKNPPPPTAIIPPPPQSHSLKSPPPPKMKPAPRYKTPPPPPSHRLKTPPPPVQRPPPPPPPYMYK